METENNEREDQPQRIEITVENEKQVRAILTALQSAEACGYIDFPFNTHVTDA